MIKEIQHDPTNQPTTLVVLDDIANHLDLDLDFKFDFSFSQAVCPITIVPISKDESKDTPAMERV